MIFGKKRVVDLTKDLDRAKRIRESMNSSVNQVEVPKQNSSQASSNFGFFNNPALSNSNVGLGQIETYGSPAENNEEPVEEKRKKLAKRLMDITDKLEDLSNQMYHMQQRLEVVERKLRVNEFNNHGQGSVSPEQNVENFGSVFG